MHDPAVLRLRSSRLDDQPLLPVVQARAGGDPLAAIGGQGRRRGHRAHRGPGRCGRPRAIRREESGGCAGHGSVGEVDVDFDAVACRPRHAPPSGCSARCGHDGRSPDRDRRGRRGPRGAPGDDPRRLRPAPPRDRRRSSARCGEHGAWRSGAGIWLPRSSLSARRLGRVSNGVVLQLAHLAALAAVNASQAPEISSSFAPARWAARPPSATSRPCRCRC